MRPTHPTTAETTMRERLIVAVMAAHDSCGLADPTWVDAPKNAAAVVDAVLAALAEPTEEMRQMGAHAPLTMDDDVGFSPALRVWKAMLAEASK